MHNSNIPSDLEVPSTRKLVKSTILAAIGASVLLVVVVMPAEYGIDPTGLGRVTGLTEMGEVKMSLAEEFAQEEAAKRIAVEDVPVSQEVAKAEPRSESAMPQPREDTMTLTLAPAEGAEIKVALKKGQQVHYEWSATGKVNFDNHGDSKALNIRYRGYGKGTQQANHEGVIEAAFDGMHGWFWRNRTKEPVTITLAANGEYSSIKRVD